MMRALLLLLTLSLLAPATTASAQQTLCPGDCAVDGAVQIGDLLLMVNVINGTRDIADCRAGDADGDGRLRAHEVTRGVVSALRGCSAGAVGQAAFYRALNGVPGTPAAIAAEEARALDQLQAAVAADEADGWSRFLLGMLHLQRLGREVDDYEHPSPFVVAEARLASAALDRAAPLLAYDNRIPGFQGAATFNLGVLTDDPVVRQRGLAQLEASLATNFLFNSFSYLGAVAPTVGRDDPLFARAIAYLDAGIQSGCTPATDPRNCGNGGRAPHNIQGSFTLFGDLYLKAGRSEDARRWYEFGLLIPGLENWRHRALLEERLATFDDRAARLADDDPSNDPRLAGVGPEACVYCHYQ